MQSIQGLWSVPADLPFFQGHFPEQPILPAVATIDLSIQWLGSQLGRKLSLKKIKNAKFTAPISPGQTIQATAVPVGEQEWQTTLQDPSSGTQFAILHLLFC